MNWLFGKLYCPRALEDVEHVVEPLVAMWGWPGETRLDRRLGQEERPARVLAGCLDEDLRASDAMPLALAFLTATSAARYATI